jgi:hypothetical protein
LKGGNNYPEGTWPPHGSKEEPVEFIQELYRNTTAEFGDGGGIIEKDVGVGGGLDDQLGDVLAVLGVE